MVYGAVTPAYNGVIRIENRKLQQEFLRLSKSIDKRQDRVPANRPRDGGNEFNDRLMRHSHGVFENPTPENGGCDSLLRGKPIIEPVYQYVGINESGNGSKDPLASSLYLPTAASAGVAGRGDARSPGQTGEHAQRGQRMAPARDRGLPESHRLPESTRFHHRDGCGSDPRSTSAR